MDMGTSCAWCGAPLRARSEATLPEGRESHGICPACAEKLLSDDGMDIDAFLRQLGVPVFLVSEDVEVLDASEAALTMVQKPVDSVLGKLGGEVFECANAELPGGCGRTIHCSGCVLRETVTATWADGVSRVRVPASLKLRPRNAADVVELRVSTARVGEGVLLKVEQAD